MTTDCYADQATRSGSLVRELRRQRFLPVIRSQSAEDAIRTGRLLLRAGVDHIELTAPIPNVIRALRVLADEGCTVGVGTVRSAKEVGILADAGARFVVSYFNPVDFIRSALDAQVTPIPGAATPSEIQKAAEESANIIKLFPASQLDPRIIGDLAPLIPGVCYLATGGITHESAAAWLRAGAVGVGVGTGFASAPREDASEFAARVAEWRDATAIEEDE